jgi:hypothetical protein
MHLTQKGKHLRTKRYFSFFSPVLKSESIPVSEGVAAVVVG